VFDWHRLNTAAPAEAAQMLDGIYEHSPWVATKTIAAYAHKQGATGRFASLSHLKAALAATVTHASEQDQLALIRAHPELAGKAMVAQTLTTESTGEQSRAGLTHCSPQEFAQLQDLNARYNAKFGHPFIVAVRGPRGTGLTRTQIIQIFERRLHSSAQAERAECLRQIHRIAEMRLSDRFGQHPTLGQELWDWHEALAVHTDPAFAELGQLAVTYLTDAHQACASDIAQRMRDCGLQHVHVDAVGNVVGRWVGGDEAAGVADFKTLITGSHFDTVRNAGKYDGRLGIFAPLMALRELAKKGWRPRHSVEVVAFAEEEGQRYKATFLASGALVGAFDAGWLDQTDADGITMRQAMQRVGLPGSLDAIAACTRDPSRYLGCVEVHIEQGPVLHDLNLPLGVVTSINGSVRYLGQMRGVASHAGTTPMNRRFDAATAVAELALYVELRAARDADSVGTVGLLNVPRGSINVVPGRCEFSLDLRAPTDAQRDALVRDVLAQAQAIADRRGMQLTLEETARMNAAPSHPAWQARWQAAVESLGVPLFKLPSGAGHDAMVLHRVMPQAMLFVRGENGGISHNPLESTSAHDMDLCVRALMHLFADLDSAA
jgi:beta-ureidopropionase / N-carbamoyl-L-amino-acid hydrolase